MFSSAGHIVNRTCSLLDPLTVSMLVCPRTGVADTELAIHVTVNRRMCLLKKFD